MTEETDKPAPTEEDVDKQQFTLIQMMKNDILTALRSGQQLVIEGEGPLGALLTVVQVAEKATAERLAKTMEVGEEKAPKIEIARH
jgi:hypothetical protein